MEKALWYLLTATRGGANRARIIRSLDQRPRNANQLAGELDVDYNTIRHHLDMLQKHDVIEAGGDDYGKLYFLTDRFERHREEFERITDRMEG
jgi:predicted ArsR family transcriptional regulator